MAIAEMLQFRTAYRLFRGLSTDSKPGLGSMTRGVFNETDTDDDYEWNGSSWVVSAHSGGVAHEAHIDLVSLQTEATF